MEKRPIAAEIEGHAAVFLSPHVQLVVVGRAVGEQDDLTLALELRRHAHAQGERWKAQGFLRCEFNKTEVCLIGEQKDFATETHCKRDTKNNNELQ